MGHQHDRSDGAETRILCGDGARDRAQEWFGTRYGLGVGVREESGQRAIAHGGEVSGFTAYNMVFPDSRTAVVVLTNEDSVGVSSDLARKIAGLLFADAGSTEPEGRRAQFLRICSAARSIERC